MAGRSDGRTGGKGVVGLLGVALLSAALLGGCPGPSDNSNDNGVNGNSNGSNSNSSNDNSSGRPTAPLIEDIADATVRAGDPYTSDVPTLIRGSGRIVWRLEIGPSGAHIDADTGVVTWAEPVEGTAPIAISATGPGGVDVESWNLTVTSSAIGTVIASLNTRGEQGSLRSSEISISDDGRFAAFTSNADNLASGDSNGFSDVFVRDLARGTTTRIGSSPNGPSRSAVISADGTAVAFVSFASNLVDADENNTADVFVYTVATGDIARVSVSSGGEEGAGASDRPSISGDGRYVAFQSLAANLVTADGNGTSDVFLHDRQTGSTTRLSVRSDGTEADGASQSPSISPGGEFVAFVSSATNLVGGDTNAVADVFLKNVRTRAIARISVANSGDEANGTSENPHVADAGGRYVVFESEANNLTDGDNNHATDVFLYDRQVGTTTLVSHNRSGAAANGESGSPWISADAQFIVFESIATNLVSPGTQNRNIFLYDVSADELQLLTGGAARNGGNSQTTHAFITPNGTFVGFESKASDLVEHDTNAQTDVFVMQR